MYSIYLFVDYNMELVIALEMSRLQMIEDKIKQAQANNNSSVTTEGVGNPGTSVDKEETEDPNCKFVVKT